MGLAGHQVAGDAALAAAPALVLGEQLVWSKDSATVRAQRDVGCDTQAVGMPLDLCLGRGFLQDWLECFRSMPPGGVAGKPEPCTTAGELQS